MTQSKNWKRSAAVFCIVMIAAYVFVMLIPHAHICVGDDCSVCALTETSRNMLLCIALTGAAWQLTIPGILMRNGHRVLFYGNSETPVSLKVKLSD